MYSMYGMVCIMYNDVCKNQKEYDDQTNLEFCKLKIRLWFKEYYNPGTLTQYAARFINLKLKETK